MASVIAGNARLATSLMNSQRRVSHIPNARATHMVQIAISPAQMDAFQNVVSKKTGLALALTALSVQGAIYV